MNISDEDRNRIRSWAARHSKIRQVYLYGSRARGESRPDSDIDLAIVMDAPDADEAYGMWSGWHSDFEKDPDLHISAKIDLQWYHVDAGLERVSPGVERDGILLYVAGD